jgi:hypothetical protein
VLPATPDTACAGESATAYRDRQDAQKREPECDRVVDLVRMIGNVAKERRAARRWRDYRSPQRTRKPSSAAMLLGTARAAILGTVKRVVIR